MVQYRCPRCGWPVTRYKRRTRSMVCLQCSHEAPREAFENEKVDPKVVIRCPQCGKRDVQFRFKSQSMYCRACGYEGKREEFERPAQKG